MKKILLIVDNFTPDLGASSFRFESVVRKLLMKGYEVNIICSYPNRINNEKINELELDNLNIYRINKAQLKTSTILRAKIYLEFLIKSLKIGVKLGKDVDIIIASSPQLLVGVSGSIISLLNKKKMILDIRDLWPDIVIDMKVMSKYNPVYWSLKVLEKLMYLGADKIVYNSPKFKSYLENKNKNKKMVLLTNGIDDYIIDFFKNKTIQNQAKKKYRILYAGNIGIAQDIILLVEFAKIYTEEVEVIIIGKGSQEELIKEKIKDNQIRNIKIINSIPRVELLEKYLEVDLLFLQLKNIKMFEKTIPSKIFEYMITGKPILYGLEGIGKKILEEFEQNYYFKCNNIKSLCDTYEKIKKDLLNNLIKKTDVEKLRKKYSRDELSNAYVKIILKSMEE